MTSAASTVPAWPSLVLPTLRALADGQARGVREIYDMVAELAEIDADARVKTLQSGQRRFENRMGWALSNAAKAKWVERIERGRYSITEAGKAAMIQYPDGIDTRQARRIFAPLWPEPRKTPKADNAPEASELSDPIEVIEDALSRIDAAVAKDLLQRLRSSHPDFFEQAVVDLLVKMGYGNAERSRRIGGSHDGGVDVLIDQDPLSLDQVYIQAKRYRDGNTVGREAIQAFVGALHGLGATRGVFLTTSSFSPAARDYASKVPTRLILIDGEKLVNLMITHRVGVQEKRTFTTVELDEDYFE